MSSVTKRRKEPNSPIQKTLNSLTSECLIVIFQFLPIISFPNICLTCKLFLTTVCSTVCFTEVLFTHVPRSLFLKKDKGSDGSDIHHFDKNHFDNFLRYVNSLVNSELNITLNMKLQSYRFIKNLKNTCTEWKTCSFCEQTAKPMMISFTKKIENILKDNMTCFSCANCQLSGYCCVWNLEMSKRCFICTDPLDVWNYGMKSSGVCVGCNGCELWAHLGCLLLVKNAEIEVNSVIDEDLYCFGCCERMLETKKTKGKANLILHLNKMQNFIKKRLMIINKVDNPRVKLKKKVVSKVILKWNVKVIEEDTDIFPFQDEEFIVYHYWQKNINDFTLDYEGNVVTPIKERLKQRDWYVSAEMIYRYFSKMASLPVEHKGNTEVKVVIDSNILNIRGLFSKKKYDNENGRTLYAFFTTKSFLFLSFKFLQKEMLTKKSLYGVITLLEKDLTDEVNQEYVNNLKRYCSNCYIITTEDPGYWNVNV